MQSRVQSSAGKSNSPINTTLVAKQQTAQPVNNTKSQSFDPKFNFDLNNISLSSSQRSSQILPKINAKSAKDNSLNQSEPETESEKSVTPIQRFAALNTKLTSRPKLKHSFNNIPMQPRLKVDNNRLQQKITEKKEEAPTEELSTKTITSPSTPPDDPGENNPESGKNRTSTIGHSLSNISISAPGTTPPSPLIQTKLTISTPGDKYEQEADTVAGKIVERINTPNFAAQARAKYIARNTTRTNHLAPRQSPLKINPSKPKKLAHPIPQSTPWITRMASVTTNRPKLSFHNNLEASIQRARGGGQPLEDKVRKPMEEAIGADFSGVNIHTDSQADELNNAIQARAFTTGQDIFFRQGEYNPENRSGQGLLAHELTHVVQQNGGTVQPKAEPEADQNTNMLRQKPDSPEREELKVSEPSQNIDVQRLCSTCEKEKEKETLQAKAITPPRSFGWCRRCLGSSIGSSGQTGRCFKSICPQIWHRYRF